MRTTVISTRVAALAAAAATVVAVTSMATPASASAVRLARSQVWHQVTPNGMENFADVGLGVGGRDSLNVIWTANGTTDGQAKILDTPVSFAGQVGRTVTLSHNGVLYSDPDAIVTGNRIDAVWNGILNTSPGAPDGTFIESRPLSGGSWSGPSYIPIPPAIADTSSDSATVGSDGKPWVAFSGSFSLVVDHAGQPAQQLNPHDKCCLYFQSLAVDGHTRATWIAYMSLIDKAEGVFAQRLNQNGTRAGKPQLMAGTRVGGNTLPRNARIAMTGRGHGRSGVYLAYVAGYPFGLRIDLAVAGTRKVVTIAKTNIEHAFADAAVSDNATGGLWLAWTTGDGSSPSLTVRESNSKVTKFGKAMRVALPSGTSIIWKVYIKAVASRLDIVALLTRHNKIAYYYTQVR